MKLNFPAIILSTLLFFGFLVRLYKLNNPIADWHSWRQADTAAVTRNWVKTHLNIFSPRFDDFSDTTGKGLYNPNGYRFVEFPLYNIFHYLFYSSFPVLSLEVWGRITTILCSLLSSLFIFLLVQRHVSQKVAFMSVFTYLFLPYNIYFSRVILPDQLMVTLWLLALLSFDTWSRSSTSFWPLGVAFFTGSLSLLVKPTAIFFLIPILWQARHFLKDKRLYIAVVGAITPILAWRAYSHLHPEGIPASNWLLNGNGIRFRPAFFRWLFYERLAKMFLGGWGIWPFLEGLFSSFNYFSVWGISALLYLVVFATGNIQHDYYQIPVIPILSIFLSIGFFKLFTKSFAHKIASAICIIFMLGFTWYDLKGNYVVNRWEIVEAGKYIDRITPQNAKVVAPYLGDTAFLYQTNRQGFPIMPLPIKDLIDSFDASYYVSVNYDADTKAIMSKYTIVETNPSFVVVKLVEPRHQ
jgi:hypothetical protein